MRSVLSRLLQSAVTFLALAAPLAAVAQTTIADPTPPAAPNRPFYASLSLITKDGAVSAGQSGLGGSKLAISNIMLTNFDSSAQDVFIFAPIFASGGHCGDPVIGGSYPRMVVIVQPNQTLVIPYPTALVVQGLHPNCIAGEVTSALHGGTVEMDVTGFLQ